MYRAVGRQVEWQGRDYKVVGMSPAFIVGAGIGMAALIIVEGRSVYINTNDLKYTRIKDASEGFL